MCVLFLDCIIVFVITLTAIILVDLFWTASAITCPYSYKLQLSDEFTAYLPVGLNTGTTFYTGISVVFLWFLALTGPFVVSIHEGWKSVS